MSTDTKAITFKILETEYPKKIILFSIPFDINLFLYLDIFCYIMWYIKEAT